MKFFFHVLDFFSPNGVVRADYDVGALPGLMPNGSGGSSLSNLGSSFGSSGGNGSSSSRSSSSSVGSGGGGNGNGSGQGSGGNGPANGLGLGDCELLAQILSEILIMFTSDSDLIKACWTPILDCLQLKLITQKLIV